MGIANKIATLAIVGYGAYVLLNFLYLAVRLFYPSIQYDYIDAKKYARFPKVEMGFQYQPQTQTQEIDGKDNVEYMLSVYVSDHQDIFSSLELTEPYGYVLSSSELFYRSPVLLKMDKNRQVLSKEGGSNQVKIQYEYYNNDGTYNIDKLLFEKQLQYPIDPTSGEKYLHAFLHSTKDMVVLANDKQRDEKSNSDMMDERGTRTNEQLMLNKNPLLLYTRTKFVEYRKRVIDDSYNLLKGASNNADDSIQNKKDAKPADYENKRILHVKKYLGLEVVMENHAFPQWNFPAEITRYTRQVTLEDSQKNKKNYYLPLFWENPLAPRTETFEPIVPDLDQNDIAESKRYNVTLNFQSVKLGWFRISCMLDNVVRQYQYSSTEKNNNLIISLPPEEINNLKKMFYEANPKLLFITLIASILHILFEVLAYKEDVAFWSSSFNTDNTNKAVDKNNDASRDVDEDGISRSGVYIKTASSIISVLYFYDQRDKTSYLVLVGGIVSMVIEIWKVYKILLLDYTTNKDRGKVESKPTTKGNETEKAKEKENILKSDNSTVEKITKIDKPKEDSEINKDGVKDEVKDTLQIRQKVDAQTIKYINTLGIPLIVAYSAYSLSYQRHSSMFSYLVHISLACVYVLEFIQMWPQIMINYHLKSVRSVPLTAFFYRFLSTFIDDLFAMVTPMPWLTRLGTFRDDIVFFVLCYQWYIYPKRT